MRRETWHWAISLWSWDTSLMFPNFLRSQVLSRSAIVRQLVYTMFISNNSTVSLLMKGKFCRTSKSLKILWNWSPAKFSLAFQVFVNSQIGEKQSYLSYNFLYLSKKRPKTNLIFFYNQISTSVKRSKEHFHSTANFRTFLLLTCSNFKLKQCERP